MYPRSDVDILGQVAVRAQRHAVVRPFSDDGWPRATCYSVYHFGTGAMFVNEFVVEVAASGVSESVTHSFRV